MIYYVILLLLPFIGVTQSWAQKQYNVKSKTANAGLFSAVTSLIALVFFLLTSLFKLTFTLKLIPYALVFGLCYATAWVGTLKAIQTGTLTLTSMIISCSLVIPTALGILLGEAVTVIKIIGMALLFAAIALVNLKFDEKSKFSLKWFIWVMIAFFTNGMCSASQNLHKIHLGDSYGHEFMIIALTLSTILLFAYTLITSKGLKSEIRVCLPYTLLNGMSNAAMNLLIIVIIGYIPNIVLYPTFSALSMIISFLMGFILFKERFTKYQYIGYGLGMVSIVLLNL
ncbi:MAG: DMT family transporter [Clostridia bacterium]|nr:DMT family transporter [Clostridia bacterium]